jgi:phage terminase large subunit-like protein
MKLSLAEQYIEDVLAGKVVTSQLVKKAVERHKKDCSRTDLHFDRKHAQHVITFIESFC